MPALLQASPLVQAAPSSQEVPLGLNVGVQPVPSHEEVASHCLGVQV